VIFTEGNDVRTGFSEFAGPNYFAPAFSKRSVSQFCFLLLRMSAFSI